MGRRSKYDDTFPALAEKYAREGLTDVQISAKLGISEHTINSYKKKYPQFDQALTRGKAPVDLKVENALLRSAVGYEVEYLEEELDAAGKVVKSKRGATHVKPNPTSLIFWLKNRRPDRWRDRQDIEHTGEIKIILDEDDAKA